MLLQVTQGKLIKYKLLEPDKVNYLTKVAWLPFLSVNGWDSLINIVNEMIK